MNRKKMQLYSLFLLVYLTGVSCSHWFCCIMEDDAIKSSSNPQPPPLTDEEKAILESDKIGKLFSHTFKV